MLEYIEANFISVCTDKHGICLVKAALNKGSWITRLALLIKQNLTQLSKDAYGNFSVQIMLTQMPESQASFFSENILPLKFADLCMDKYASNVIDKVIKNCYK